jgi:hypothetical protein
MSISHPLYLYHYTSIESLALILHNGTILFNSLQKVDDLEEVECNDVKDYGKYCYVSCWTDVEEESIPLWKMYTPDMKGVRIKLPLYPFKKYKFDEIVLPFKYNNVFPSFPIETYINYETLEKERRAFIFPNEPKLVQIEYTEDKNLLYQNVLEKIANENGNEATYNITLRNDKIGKYKMERWAFQKEWRYILFLYPQFNDWPSNTDSLLEYAKKVLSEDTQIPYSNFFLQLDKSLFFDMEILLGPKTNVEHMILVSALAEKYCGTAQNIKKSELRIR